jgi:hypothetical protein
MEIRSYRRVFDLERRIYRVDRLRLNPGGVPVRGVVYFLLIVVAVIVARRLPLVGRAAGAMPWYLRDVILPGAGAAVLGVIRVEGRPFHLAAQAVLRYRVRARWLSRLCPGQPPGRRWHPEDVLWLPNGSEARMRHLRYTGPGAVLIALQHEHEVRAARFISKPCPGRAPNVIVSELPGAGRLDRGRVIALGPRSSLLVRATRTGEQSRS